MNALVVVIICTDHTSKSQITSLSITSAVNTVLVISATENLVSGLQRCIACY
jgi:hypothetical protein